MLSKNRSCEPTLLLPRPSVLSSPLRSLVLARYGPLRGRSSPSPKHGQPLSDSPSILTFDLWLVFVCWSSVRYWLFCSTVGQRLDELRHLPRRIILPLNLTLTRTTTHHRRPRRTVSSVLDRVRRHGQRWGPAAHHPAPSPGQTRREKQEAQHQSSGGTDVSTTLKHRHLPIPAPEKCREPRGNSRGLFGEGG